MTAALGLVKLLKGVSLGPTWRGCHPDFPRNFLSLSFCCQPATNQPQYSRRVLVEADEGRPRLVGVDGGGHEGGKGGDDGSEVDFEVHPALLRHPIACTLLS